MNPLTIGVAMMIVGAFLTVFGICQSAAERDTEIRRLKAEREQAVATTAVFERAVESWKESASAWADIAMITTRVTGRVIASSSPRLSQAELDALVNPPKAPFAFFKTDTNRFVSRVDDKWVDAVLPSAPDLYKYPEMTTAQRDAMVNPMEGLMIKNLTTGRHELYRASGWQNLPDR